jgi:hypothetical protein
LEPQQPLPFFDAVEHLPAAQQVILPAWSFDIMEQALPSLPWQQLPPLQHALPLPQQAASLPQHAILPSAWSWLQQAQVLALSLPVAGDDWFALCAISARAITTVLSITRTFDFMISSEFRLCGLAGPLP